MKRIRKMGTAAVVAAVLATGMTFGAARVEAKGKGGGDAQEAVCAYLLQVITYPYVNSYIKQFAIQVYLGYGCDPAKLP
jgi:hypothetical protein